MGEWSAPTGFQHLRPGKYRKGREVPGNLREVYEVWHPGFNDQLPMDPWTLIKKAPFRVKRVKGQVFFSSVIHFCCVCLCVCE